MGDYLGSGVDFTCIFKKIASYHMSMLHHSDVAGIFRGSCLATPMIPRKVSLIEHCTVTMYTSVILSV